MLKLENITLTFYEIIPIPSLLYRKDIRTELKFLQNKKSLIREIGNSFLKGYKRAWLHFLGLGELRFRRTNDELLYYKKIKSLIRLKSYVRPLIPLTTEGKKIKKNLKELSSVILKQFKKVLLLPSFVFIIVRTYVVKAKGLTNQRFYEIIRILKKEISKEKKNDLIRILKASFNAKVEIPINISDVYTIIETSTDNKEKARLLGKVPSKSWRIQDATIITQGYSIRIIIYDSRKTKTFRRRIKWAIMCGDSIKILRQEISLQLSIQALEELKFHEKLDFIIYLLETLNPDNYSTREKKTFLLLRDYQRQSFEFIIKVNNEREFFNKLLDKIVVNIKNEYYLQDCLMLEKNVYLEPLKIRIQSMLPEKDEKYVEPKLDKKHEYVLRYLIDAYERALSKNAALLSDNPQRKMGKVTATQLRENINEWLLKTGVKEKIFVDRDFTPTPPKIVRDLEKLGLVKIERRPKNPKALFYINNKHPYIRKLIKK